MRFIPKYTWLYLLLGITSSCTINIIQTATDGVADDVVDTTATTDVKPTTDIKVPLPLG